MNSVGFISPAQTGMICTTDQLTNAAAAALEKVFRHEGASNKRESVSSIYNGLLGH